MPAIVRIGDPISCGDVMAEGSGNVFANGLPVSREGVDLTAGHCYPPVPVTSGSSSVVYINSIPSDRVGDPIQPHCCGDSCHRGSVANGSPNVFVDSGGGAGTIIDNNVIYSNEPIIYNSVEYPPTNPMPLEAQPDPPYPITSADIHILEHNDDPDGTLLGPPSGTSLISMAPTQTDLTPPPPSVVPSQDCSDIEAYDPSFNWIDGSPTPANFTEWADGVQLSPNFTVADLTVRTAVSYYPFNTSVIQLNGLTQKEILLNMCFLSKTILEPMLSLFGPFTITSAFRNKAGTSQHNRGMAVDIQFLDIHPLPNTGNLYFERAQTTRDNINFDQLILEWFGKNPWIHISANSSGHRQEVLTQTGSNSFTPGLILLERS